MGDNRLGTVVPPLLAIADQANGNYHLNGRVDDAAIHAPALSADTIASHYQAALHGPAPG
jgi:hypothetical protein